MPQVTRYHPLLVWAHWILAALSVAALYFGAVKLAHIPNGDPYKIRGLRVHMIVGTLIAVLTGVRLWVRQVTVHPPKASAGSAFLDGVAELSHRLLYAALIGQALLGLALAYQSGLVSVVFAHRGSVPADFGVYWPREGHYWVSRLLMVLIALHVSGALYHTFILKDGLLHRMGFGKQTASSQAPATTGV